MVNICVCGNWHQFAVISDCLAEIGYSVHGVAADAELISALNAGQLPVYEPGLDEIMQRNLANGRLTYTPDYARALHQANFVFIAIDTPVLDDDSSDLSGVFAVAEQIGRHASDDLILCVSAQVPVGTSERLQALAQRYSSAHIQIAYVPEFLRLGNAVKSFHEADRFIIGSNQPAVAAQVAEIYKPLGRPILTTTLRSAEMIKHASNAFLAMAISFINEIADLCEATGADVTEVSKGMKLDKRIGPHAFLGAGLGFAGGTLGRGKQA